MALPHLHRKWSKQGVVDGVRLLSNVRRRAAGLTLSLQQLEGGLGSSPGLPLGFGQKLPLLLQPLLPLLLLLLPLLLALLLQALLTGHRREFKGHAWVRWM